MNAAHAALRDGTRAEHERLDALLGGFDLSDRDQYRAFLIAHGEASFPVEAALADTAGLVIEDWPARSRRDALAADLSALAATPAGDASVPDLSDPAAAAGALYVLEGSRLGGRFLVKQVGEGFPQAYLGDEQPRGRWPALLAALDRTLTDPAATARAVAAARDVFARFETAARHQVETLGKPLKTP